VRRQDLIRVRLHRTIPALHPYIELAFRSLSRLAVSVVTHMSFVMHACLVTALCVAASVPFMTPMRLVTPRPLMRSTMSAPL